MVGDGPLTQILFQYPEERLDSVDGLRGTDVYSHSQEKTVYGEQLEAALDGFRVRNSTTYTARGAEWTTVVLAQ